jgi:hypothetical protein
LDGHDLSTHNRSRIDSSEEHSDQVEYGNFGTGHERLHPQPEVS